MAGQRLTDKSSLDQNLATDDLLMVVDASDTTGSAEGTSKKVENKYIIKTAQKNLTSAQVNAMATGYEIVPNPGTGYQIQLLAVTVYCKYLTVQNDAGAVLQIGYNQVYSPADEWSHQGKFYNKMGNKSATYSFCPTLQSTGNPTVLGGSLDNKAMYITASANFNGTWEMVVYTTYQIVKIV